MKKLTLQERFGLWEKLPNKDVMDFPIGPLTDEQYEEILDKIGIPRTIDDMGNNIEQQYLDLLKDIINNGVKKTTRNGETLSVFGRQIRHKMSEGFPLLTTKKMAWKQIVTELIWFLKGDTNIKYLVDNDCHIWDGDAYKRYERVWNYDLDEPLPIKDFVERIKTDDEFAKTWAELGPVYGKQWRSWGRKGKYVVNEDLKFSNGTFTEIDQIQNLINELKTNPDSRRMMVNAWNVGELDQMTLPPCHYGFQVYTRELHHNERINLCLQLRPETKFAAHVETNETLMDDWNIPKRAISLMYNTRSQDVPLGSPFNIASYALLLMIIAKQVNMVPDELITNMGDCHIYLNQIEGVKEQLTRTPYELPTVKISDKQINDISEYEIGDFILENYQSHSSIKMPLSN